MPGRTEPQKEANRIYMQTYRKLNRERINAWLSESRKAHPERMREWNEINRPAGSARQSWYEMKKRCFNPNHHAYHNYGGRGITVCDRWLVFENFLADMGERPEGKYIDRFPNNNGNYEPGNCRWATRKEQANNCRPRRRK